MAMPVRFGATILQVVPFPQLRDDFAFAESIGLDNAWVIDQFWIDEVPEMPLLEAWTTLAALARETRRIRIGAMVTNVATRNPAMLAKSILTVDQVSGGRVEAAVGGGFYPSEHAAMGIEFLDGPGRGSRLRETVAVLDEALRGHTVDHDGEHVHLSGAVFRPGPTQSPRPPLWVAAQATRSLRVAVRYADAVVTLGEQGKGIEDSLPAFRRRMDQVDELCATEGRDPATLRRCLFAGWANEPIFGSVEATAEYVGRYVEAGATTSRSTSTTPPSRRSTSSSPRAAWPPASSWLGPRRTSSRTTDRGRPASTTVALGRAHLPVRRSFVAHP